MSTFLLHLRDQEVGGAVTSGRLYRFAGGTETDWDDQLPDFTVSTRGKRLLVLLHGYNVSLSEGRNALGRYMDILAAGGFAALMLAVLWPGDGWAKALTYPFEGRDADDSADALCRWLATHADPSATIAFVGHSLGCRVVMGAARRLARNGGGLRLDRICLMAPAIDNDSLGRVGTTCYQEATLAADRLAVLASKQDMVLHYAYPLGDLAQTILYGECWGRALGRTGPDEHDAAVLARIEPVPPADPARNVGHGDYLAAGAPGHTVADSEAFVLGFLARAPQPRWPAQQP